jgi:type I restriction enzyme R subunit
VARTFKEKLFAEIFPGRREVPKTIVFAKTDSHAEDIVQAIREEFNAGNDFCRKITFKADNPDTALRSFRNDYNPRIAVTVDMIATGTDVKPVECLLFMRDVRSRNYFEQMKGRGTRTLAEDDLKKVTPSANGNKPRFVIVDAVGVTQSLKADPRPFERRPSVSLKDLMDSVVMGARDEDTLTTLAGRLTRLDKQLTPAEQKRFVEVSGGPTISDVAKSLWNAHDEDHIEKTGRTSDELAEIAAAPFYDPKLRDFVETARRAHEQVIDNTNLDTLNAADWSQDNEAKAQEYIANFRRFIEDNKDEITALSIFYSGAWRTRPLTHRMIEEVHEAMQKAGITTEWLWRAYTVVRKDDVRAKSPINKLTDIVSLVRFELGHAAELRPYGAVVDANFQKWVFEKNAGHAHFTEEQMKWLRWVRDLVAESLAVTREDLELPPFVGSGGLGRFYELFGDGYEALLEEISLALGA